MTKDTEEKKDTARDQARAQAESVTEMVKRLEHAQECAGGEVCEATNREIIEGLGWYYKEGDKATDEQAEEYHDEDKARERILEDALSVEVRKDWHTPGDTDTAPDEFNILLCTGGPAVRIMGDLDEHAEPTRAYMQYQDWFTPWADYFGEGCNVDDLLTYAQQFYYSEC